jgi:hypothetical protein
MDNNLSYADFAAMTGNSGMGNMWNNPFMYLIWLAMFQDSGTMCPGLNHLQ